MNFNKREVKRLRQALYVAIDSEESLIDAHRTELLRKAGEIVRYIPKEHRLVVAMFKRNVVAWEKLLAKLSVT